MKFQVVDTKVGWVVQNMQTYTIVAGPYGSKNLAQAVVKKLNSK